jgi:hypothetical protein
MMTSYRILEQVEKTNFGAEISEKRNEEMFRFKMNTVSLVGV